MNIFHFMDYRDYLNALFEKRQKRNSAYSLRAFARDLGVAASLVCRILLKKDSVNADSILKMADALKLNEGEKAYFVELHRLRKSGDTYHVNRLREIHGFEMTRMNTDGTYHLDFHDFINFMKMNLLDEKKSLDELAGKIDCHPDILKQSCERLAAAGYLLGDSEGGWRSNLSDIVSADDLSVSKLDFHRLYLMNAIDKIVKPANERYFYSALRTFKKEDYQEISRKLEKFLTSQNFSPSPEAEQDTSFLLGAQLMPLERLKWMFD